MSLALLLSWILTFCFFTAGVSELVQGWSAESSSESDDDDEKNWIIFLRKSKALLLLLDRFLLLLLDACLVVLAGIFSSNLLWSPALLLWPKSSLNYKAR